MRERAFWSWKPVGTSSEHLIWHSKWVRDKPHIDLPQKYPSMILTFWKFHSLEDILHIVFTSFLVSHSPPAQQLLQTQTVRYFVAWQLTFECSLSLRPFFFPEVMYYLKPGIRKGNCENQNTIGIGFCYRNCIFIKCGECTVLHVRAECGMLKIELLLMEPRRKIKIAWINWNTDLTVAARS